MKNTRLCDKLNHAVRNSRKVSAMAQDSAIKLDTGDLFPTMEIKTVEGDIMVLPDNLEGVWNVLLFYRGHRFFYLCY
ncbi:hypothetical protein BMS3Abin07_01246 [bacterium BMS3Abin07]|nr:hypothetical protein BMS3Abin07_01246 [bacterium BMS3Abin07]GBE33213.1 hypothetical protein BMS3Bbin05_02152 [bacterium BMS3Bbin05]